MRRMLQAMLLWLCFFAGADLGLAAQTPDSPDARRHAAERLFELPAYRQIASRQVYEAVGSLPEGQSRSAMDALSDPKVIQALRDVIVRSMAQTFTVAELQSLARFLATNEANSMVQKTDAFQATLVRGLLAAGLTNPDLARILIPR